MGIFIAGCGRSGSSYLRTLLDAHPDIFVPSESLFLVDYLREAERVPSALWRWLLAHEPQLLCWYNGSIPRSHSPAFVIDRIHRLEAEKHGARLWGQKTPRFIRSRSLIDNAFHANFWIYIYRDPRAVVSSMLASGQHTSSVAMAVRRWKRDNKPIIDHLAAHNADKSTCVVSYETMIRRPNDLMHSLFSSLGVPAHSLEDLLSRSRVVFFSRSRFPINTIRDGVAPDAKSIDAWKKKLSDHAIQYIEHHCLDEMAALGYQPVNKAPGIPPGPIRRVTLWFGVTRDPWILVRYLWYWPEYPAWTLLRKIIFKASIFFRFFQR